MKGTGLILYVLLSAVHAAPSSDIQVVERGEIIADAGLSIPSRDGPWQPVTLPHRWYVDRVVTASQVWIRMEILVHEPRRSHSIYMSRLWVDDMSIHVNGKHIWDTAQRWWSGSPAGPIFVVIPRDLLNAGSNTIHLRISANPASFHGVTQIHFGETVSLRERTTVSRFLQADGRPIMRVFGVIGLLVLVLWLWTKRPPVLFWYAVSATGTWVLSELTYAALYGGGSTTLWQNTTIALRYQAYLMPVLIMHLRVAGTRNRYEPALWLVFLGALLSIVLPHPWRESAVALAAIGFLCMPVLFALILLLAPGWPRKPAIVLLLLGDIAALLLYVYEPGMQLDWIPIDAPRFGSTYAPAAVMLGALAPVIQFVLAARHSARRRTEETQARLRQAEQERALAEQRRRIMADMHDGLGARLAALLSMAQSGKVEAKELGDGIVAALDDLRMAIDAVEPVEGDVSVVLGNVRHRMRSVLEGAGVRLLWNVSELPAIQDLTPQRVLAIQRILLEVFTNIIKHSRARTVFVSTARLPGAVEITIEDDGCGFLSEMSSGGRGLSNLQVRSAEAGCTVKVVSAPGQGTRVSITLPTQDDAPFEQESRDIQPVLDDHAGPVLGSKPVSLAFGMAALALALITQAQESAKPSRRVPGAELREWFSDEPVVAGIDHRSDCVLLITGPSTRRVQYYNCPDGVSGTLTGSVRIEGDTKCSTYKGSRQASGCREWHEVGEDKFLLRSDGVFTHTIYKLQEAGKPSRRVPGAELREWLSDEAAYAGINHTNGCAFLIAGSARQRNQYFSCPDGWSRTVTGSLRFEGDMHCASYPDLKEPTDCREWHQVGESKFLLRTRGVFSHTVYKLR